MHSFCILLDGCFNKTQGDRRGLKETGGTNGWKVNQCKQLVSNQVNLLMEMKLTVNRAKTVNDYLSVCVDSHSSFLYTSGVAIKQVMCTVKTPRELAHNKTCF